MEILCLKKNETDSVFSCTRKDGSKTWRHIIPFFISHDICHFAVEKILCLKNGFYRMVAAGIDINEFDLPKEERKFVISEEAIFTEHLVNLLTIEYAQGKMDNFMEVFSALYEQHAGTDFYTVLTGEKLSEIRNFFNDLMQQWHLLPVHKTMTLFFEE